MCVCMVKLSNSIFSVCVRHKAGQGDLTASCGCPGLGLLFQDVVVPTRKLSLKCRIWLFGKINLLWCSTKKLQ